MRFLFNYDVFFTKNVKFFMFFIHYNNIILWLFICDCCWYATRFLAQFWRSIKILGLF